VTSPFFDFTGGPPPGPNVTISRGDANGTYVTGNGLLVTGAANTDRWDYDPITHMVKGLLVEPAHTNRLWPSNDFSNARWTKNRASVFATPSITAPDGTTNTTKLVEDTTANNTHNVGQPYTSATVGQVYIYSMWLKAAERTTVAMVIGGLTSFANATFNLSTGTILSAVAGAATISPYPNGWYLCTVSGVADATTISALAYTAQSTGATTYTGDGASGLYLFGAQLIPNNTYLSYVATTTGLNTCSSDNVSLNWGALNVPDGNFQFRYTFDDLSQQIAVGIVTSGHQNVTAMNRRSIRRIDQLVIPNPPPGRTVTLVEPA
jgi:hypothetical protein